MISSSRKIFDDALPFLSSDLSFEEIDLLRPLVYTEISKESNDILFIKTHDAFTHNVNNEEIFPKNITHSVIHIVRNPLDVAVSFAHHSHIPIDKSINTLNSEEKCLACKKSLLNKQLRQKLLSWSEHYYSWKHSQTHYLLIKYEDLLSHPKETFKKILIHIYKHYDSTKLEQAIAYSSFSELKKQENKNPFKEKPLHAEAFFRKGKKDSWKEEMTTKQQRKIIDTHQKVMQELGYLDN